MGVKRIIPCLDVKGGRVVKGIKFGDLRDAGDPVAMAVEYEAQGADELVFLDITATIEGRKTMVHLVKQLADNISLPFTVGGGIRTLDDISTLLKAGADKVSLGTAAVKNPGLVTDAAREFGKGRIVVAIDARRTAAGKWETLIRGGAESAGVDAVIWAQEMEKRGAGEILLTSFDSDGTKDGYDLELTRAVSEAVQIPVIASGGAGRLEHIYQAVTTGKADGALAASIFHYREYTIRQAKEYLAERGVSVRL